MNQLQRDELLFNTARVVAQIGAHIVLTSIATNPGFDETLADLTDNVSRVSGEFPKDTKVKG